MRGSRSSWLFGGFALALWSSVLLTGCAVAPAEPDEATDEIHGELDGRRTEKTDSGGSTSAASSKSGPVAPTPADVHEPDPLPWKDFTSSPTPGTPDDGEAEEAAARVASQDAQEPDPLPWHPLIGDNKDESSAHVDDAK